MDFARRDFEPRRDFVPRRDSAQRDFETRKDFERRVFVRRDFEIVGILRVLIL